ncbi:hypothetical protein ACWCQZ_43475 [Streptomyces sp. NPDC002285]
MRQTRERSAASCALRWQDQKDGPQLPVGSVAPGAAAGRLIQHCGVEQPYLSGQRTEVGQCKAVGMGQLQPQLPRFPRRRMRLNGTVGSWT